LFVTGSTTTARGDFPAGIVATTFEPPPFFDTASCAAAAFVHLTSVIAQNPSTHMHEDTRRFGFGDFDFIENPEITI
jgi:hypothetical protein